MAVGPGPFGLIGTSVDLEWNGIGFDAIDCSWVVHGMVVAGSQGPTADFRGGCIADSDTCSPFGTHCSLGMALDVDRCAYCDLDAFVSYLHDHLRLC